MTVRMAVTVLVDVDDERVASDPDTRFAFEDVVASRLAGLGDVVYVGAAFVTPTEP